jgi:hypothetical protein
MEPTARQPRLLSPGVVSAGRKRRFYHRLFRNPSGRDSSISTRQRAVQQVDTSMIIQNEAMVTEAVRAGMAATPNQRLREVMDAVVRHLHAFVT